MAYQIVKGWPALGAIDESIEAATGVTLAAGKIAAINDDGDGILADFNVNGSDAGLTAAFLIDHDSAREGFFTGLISECVIEVDADHYEAGTYKAGDTLTADGGKFDGIAATSDDRPVIAKVLKEPDTQGIMRVLWLGAR